MPVAPTARGQAGELYVALRGEHHNGHSYLAQALATARAALVSEVSRTVDLPLIARQISRALAISRAFSLRWGWPLVHHRLGGQTTPRVRGGAAGSAAVLAPGQPNKTRLPMTWSSSRRAYVRSSRSYALPESLWLAHVRPHRSES